MKNIKIFTLGPQRVGKTSILHQLLYGQARGYNNKRMPKCLPTIEDVYFATVDLPSTDHHYSGHQTNQTFDRHNNEANVGSSSANASFNTNAATSVVLSSKRNAVNDNQLLFFDVAGIKQNIDIELLRNYLAFADDFILVYSINDRSTFNLVDTIKKLIDQSKGRRENPIIVLGNKLDLDSERQVDFDEAHVWAKREHIKLFEVTATERETLNDFTVYLASRFATPQTQASSSSAFKLRRSKTVQSS